MELTSTSHTNESKGGQSVIPFAKNKCIHLTRRQHKFLCLERATIANRQGAIEDQRFVAKPTQSNMNLFFTNGMTPDLTQEREKWGLNPIPLESSKDDEYLALIVKPPARLDCIKDPTVLELENLSFSSFHIIALLLFVFAIIHTLSIRKVHNWARQLEMRQPPKRLNSDHERKFSVQLLYFLSEIEVVFAFWAIFLFFAIVSFYGWHVALDYIDTREYTEPLFVAVILALSATKPIILLAEKCVTWCTTLFGSSISSWWLTLLTIGPLLGSFITEVGAMTLCALLLSRQFYQYRPSSQLAYGTLGLLFVNISVGGVLTNFASPAVLILSHAWNWSTPHIFYTFGWKILLGITLSNFIYWIYFRKELNTLNTRKKMLLELNKQKNEENGPPVPFWITMIHVLFIIWSVTFSHYPAIFVGSFLLFIGFHQATRSYQYPIRLARPMLVGLFLAGLVIHGGLQGWWVLRLLDGLSPLAIMGTTILLAGFNDNAAIAYLTILLPDWGETFKYAIFTGIVAGGGLTVIANAPNPVGYAILRHHFSEGIRPLKLLKAAITPTLILYAIFYFLGPLMG
jgi:hypothetical protein